MTVPGLRLGAPGVYQSVQRVEPPFQPVRLDVCGFVGVALRGPVNAGVLIQSWSDYQRTFGGFERPGGGPDRMLPYTVAAFFAQGGSRAYVVRVTPAGSDLAGAVAACASYQVGPLQLTAANEGSWGDRLDIQLDFQTPQSFVGQRDPDLATALLMPAGAEVPAGSLLRLRGTGLTAAGEFRWVLGLGRDTAGQPLITVDPPVGAIAAGPLDVDVVTAVLTVTDRDPDFARSEQIDGLGLDPRHPRFIGAVVGDITSAIGCGPGDHESTLVRFADALTGRLTPPGPLLPSLSGTLIRPGTDRWDQIGNRSFFDDAPPDTDPLDEQPHRGADLMARQDEIGLLCVPDLLWAWPSGTPAAEQEPDTPSACFQRCPDASVPLPGTGQVMYAEPNVLAARLDPGDPVQLQTIVDLQSRLVTLAAQYRRFVALLDVPPGLALAEIVRWRAHFDSSYAAAYHPWLGVPQVQSASGTAGQAVQVPPSAFAAGVIAAREQRLTIAWGPANEIAVGAVVATDSVTDSEHDRLHLLGINVYRQERDGFRLTAARTLGSDPDYRQLSVRRLMTMIALSLDRQAQWLVFEPNTADLRDRLTHTVTEFLRGLFQAGALAGNTEADSFFVQCDDQLNPPESQGLGQLIAEVGIAPASPLEYLVLRITQDADGTISVEASGG
jgi:uncharacterized protein